MNKVTGYSNYWTVRGVIDAYLQQHPNATKTEINSAFDAEEVFPRRKDLFIPAEEQEELTDKHDHSSIIKLSDGEYMIAPIWHGFKFKAFKENASKLGISITQKKPYNPFTKGWYELENEDREEEKKKKNGVKTKTQKQSQKRGCRPPHLTFPNIPIAGLLGGATGCLGFIGEAIAFLGEVILLLLEILLIIVIIALIIFLIWWLLSLFKDCSCSDKEYKEANNAPTEVVVKDTVIEESFQVVPLADNVNTEADSAVAEVEDECTKTLKSLVSDSVVIYFKVNSYEIPESDFSGLDCISHYLGDNANVNVQIDGHASIDGTKNINNRISRKRTSAISAYFANKGIPAKRIKTKGYGAGRPTGEGAERDRRAVIRIKK